MATTGVERVFVDTNVLVYANVAQAPLHAEAVQKLQDLDAAGVELWTSRQVLREYLATLTRPQTYVAPQPPAVLMAQVIQFIQQMEVADEDQVVTTHLLNLLSAIVIAGKQVHDANIVATMQAHSIPKLLTHNVADFARFTSLITIIPLVP